MRFNRSAHPISYLLTFAYKKMRELYRRMHSYRGEIPAGYPRFIFIFIIAILDCRGTRLVQNIVYV
jgi:hypothetical protein